MIGLGSEFQTKLRDLPGFAEHHWLNVSSAWANSNLVTTHRPLRRVLTLVVIMAYYMTGLKMKLKQNMSISLAGSDFIG